MVVGLDFCQTDYKFIEHNISKRAVRYYTAKHDGVFHPKVYLFYDDMRSLESDCRKCQFDLQWFFS